MIIDTLTHAETKSSRETGAPTKPERRQAGWAGRASLTSRLGKGHCRMLHRRTIVAGQATTIVHSFLYRLTHASF